MSTDGWYPAAIADPAATDAGAFHGPVDKGVLHTTESPLGRYRSGGPNDYGNFGHTNFPHFTCDVQHGVFRAFQHINIRHAAKALKNLPGGVLTNTIGAVQIEVVGSATHPFTDDPVMVAGLSALMRWIESQTQITPTSTVRFAPYPASAGFRAAQRLSGAAWNTYRGWLGHQHVPENDHGDPGAIDISRLLPARGKPAVVAKAVTAVKVVAAKLTRTDPVLRLGDHGAKVADIQRALVKAGHHLVVDGQFGNGTYTALRAFQHSRQLPVDGVCGAATWAALRVVAHG